LAAVLWASGAEEAVHEGEPVEDVERSAVRRSDELAVEINAKPLAEQHPEG
jgi:hypothetical protein